MNGNVRLAVVDDHVVVREGVRRFAERCTGLEVCWVATGGQEALRLASSSKPDVALVDLKMPLMGGCEVVSLLRAQNSGLVAVMFSAYPSLAGLRNALAAGASGFIAKEDGCTSQDFGRMLFAAAAGREVYSPAVFPLFSSLARNNPRAEPRAVNLKDRQLAILDRAAGGLSDREIATSVNVSPSTLARDWRRIQELLSAGSRSQAVAIAIRQSIIP